MARNPQPPPAGIPVTPGRPVVVTWDDGTQSEVIPQGSRPDSRLPDTLFGQVVTRRDGWGRETTTVRRAVRVEEIA